MDAHALPPRCTPRRAAGAALALLVVLCAMAGPAAAQMYKWVDERGQTHRSELHRLFEKVGGVAWARGARAVHRRAGL